MTLTMILILQNLLLGLLLDRNDGFVQSCVERLHAVVLQFDLQNLIEVQDGSVCAANLEVLADHPCIRLAFL